MLLFTTHLAGLIWEMWVIHGYRCPGLDGSRTIPPPSYAHTTCDKDEDHTDKRCGLNAYSYRNSS